MAKVTYVSISPGMEDVYKKFLQPGDRFQFSRVRVKDIFLSRSRVKGITQKSQLVALAPAWEALSEPVKAAWNAAGAESGLTGWKQFVQDTTERIKAGYTGYATPSTLYQSEVGRILVESPAVGLKIEQAHPLTYYVQRKVSGTRSQYQMVPVVEPFAFPLTLACSWKTELTALDSDARARLYAVIYSQYQGRTIETELALNFGMSDEWQRDEVSIENVLGFVKGYTVFMEVHNARGSLYFDNVAIEHSGENWARDPHCNNVSASFTKAFVQVARAWVAVNPTEGTDYGSVYYLA